MGEALVVNSADDIYVTGTSLSNNFPVTAGAYDTAYPPAASGTSSLTLATTGFVTEIAAGGTSLIYSTYLGGNDLAGYPIINDYLFTVATDIYGYDPNRTVGRVTARTWIMATPASVSPWIPAAMPIFRAQPYRRIFLSPIPAYTSLTWPRMVS